jgi:hypothetical protein
VAARQRAHGDIGEFRTRLDPILYFVQLFKAPGGGWEKRFPDVPSETAAVPVPADFVDRAIR